MAVTSELNHALFAKHIEQTFQLLNEDVQLDLILTEASLLSQHSEQKQQGFTLLFKADNSMSLEQRIYSLQHKEIGEFSLFLVPISQDETNFYYEAVFN